MAGEFEFEFRRLTKEALGAKTKTKGEENEDENGEPRFELEQGKILPLAAAASLDIQNLAGVPLEDIDPYYQGQRTFVIVNGWKKEIFRFSSGAALGLFGPFNPIRSVALAILTHGLFHPFIIASVFLHFYLFVLPSSAPVNMAINIGTGVFIFEMVIKLLARGLVKGKFTYLRTRWNWLDFVLNVIGFFFMLTATPVLGAFLVFRILRLLTMRYTGVQIFAASVTKSIMNLGNVGILVFFYLFVFAVFGLQVYMGILTQKCIENYPEDWSPSEYSDWAKDSAHWSPDPVFSYGYKLCSENNASMCEESHTCTQGFGPNPDYGLTSFDNFGWSFLAATRLLTASQDYWEALYHQVLATAGPLHVIFFIVGIFFGSYFLFNLILVTVIMSFDQIVVGDKDKKKKDGDEEEPTARVQESSLSCADGNATPCPSHLVDMSDTPIPHKNAEPEGWCTRCLNLICIWDCGFPFRNVQNLAGLIVKDPFFDLFIFANILLNVFFMCLDHYGLERNLSLLMTLKCGNKIFTIIFAIEAGLKIFALSPRNYFGVGWNRFDFFVAVVPLIEVAFQDANLPGISALRAFRVLRIFRLANFWPSISLRIIERSLDALRSLAFVAFVIISVFAMIGISMYSFEYYDKVNYFPGNEMPRWNFWDMGHAWMLVFRILCGEWIETMWDCLHVSDATCFFYWLPAVIICNLIIPGLYLALVLRARHDIQLYPIGPNRIRPALDRISRFGRWLTCAGARSRVKSATLSKVADASAANEEIKVAMEDEDEKKDDEVISVHSAEKEKMFQDATTSPDPNQMVKVKGAGTGAGAWTAIRGKTGDGVNSKYFEAVVMVIIVFSCFLLAFEDVHVTERRNRKMRKSLDAMNKVFILFFLLEMILKWIGLGFTKYFKCHWCRFEFALVLVTGLNPIMNLCGFRSLQILASMRSLRVIRLIKVLARGKSIKVVLHAMKNSLGPLRNILFICFWLWLVFALMGIQLFNGKFYKCLDYEGTRPDYRIIKNKIDCEQSNYTWANSAMNFDHVGKSFLSLLQVATFKGWILIMNDGIDSRFVDEQPVRELNFMMYWYFVLFIVIAGLLTRSLVTSVIIDNFVTAKQVEEFGDDDVDFDAAAAAAARAKAKKPIKLIPPPTWKPQLMVYNAVMNPKFEALFMILILLNMFVMSFDHYQQSQTWEDVLTYMNMIFIIVFTLEAVIKIIGLRQHYFKSAWNVFDFIVVILSLLGLMLSDLIAKYFVSPSLLRCIRVFRIGRLVGIFPLARGILTLLRIFRMSFPFLVATTTLLFLLIFVYAIFGMGFFMHVRLVGGLDPLFNFQTFQGAFLVLYQISTVAGWDGIFDGLASEKDDCEIPDPEFGRPGNCGNFNVAVFYVVSFLLFCYWFILNMMIAIVYANHREAIKDAEEGITDEDFDKFYQKWAQFSPDGSEFIRQDQLTDFLATLDPPFHISKDKAMDIPISNGDMVSSADVLDVLIKNFFAPKGTVVEEIEMEAQTTPVQNTDPSPDVSPEEKPNEEPDEIVEEP